MQSVFTALSFCLSPSLPPFSFLSLCLFGFVSGLSDRITLASFFSSPPGCSPDSAPCACWTRRQSGPFSTTSCACSAHHLLYALNSCFLRLFSPQRIPLAFFIFLRSGASALLLSSSSRLPCALTSSSPSSRVLPSSSCSSLSLFSSCSPLFSSRCSS